MPKYVIGTSRIAIVVLVALGLWGLAGPGAVAGAPFLDARIRLTTDDLLNVSPTDFSMEFVTPVPFEGLAQSRRGAFAVRPCPATIECFGGGALSTEAVARARVGELGVGAAVQLDATGSGLAAGAVVADSDARFAVFDTRVRGTTPTALMTFLIDVDGLLLMDATGMTGRSSGEVQFRLDFEVFVEGNLPRRGALHREVIFDFTRDPARFDDNLGITTGVLEGYRGGSATLAVGPFVVPTNRPFTTSWHAHAHTLVTTGHGFGDFRGVLASVVDYCCSFGFPTDGPVVELPDGFTLESDDARVVGSRWLGAADTAAPVGVPPSLVLLGAGAVALALVRARERAALSRLPRPHAATH